ncbi:DEAD/DEAH box helicase [Anaerobacillus sp. CMMVII]|uniref:DEAD/DEAH box helicase n=1 Tax=Anaerobacillus sp. CMMVII TaxID=2755588 RepID=UPI0021B7FF5D|nr:DEAD/DEAH box helicase [Anaerobacillus sp. CMMVII]MCT8140490.1 DEAD/DEAH box helicase [Anaerobacillus sp. CMMVII]
MARRFADFAAKGLFGDEFPLHLHQYQAFKNVLINQKNIVVTSGTGSGKTESFLIPLIANILKESENWTPPKPKEESWWNTENKWKAVRSNETRKAAVRGLILYPLNALVEDQLGRLRKALDSDLARNWLKSYRNGNKLYFGRYTGKTPIPGKTTDNNKQRKLKGIMQGLEHNQAQLRDYYHNLITSLTNNLCDETKKKIKFELQNEKENEFLFDDNLSDQQINTLQLKLQGKLDEKLTFLSQVDGSELVSRWDMQEYPPDILITNFSMLNIILTRQIEQKMFETTKEWLAEDKSNSFYLILDELHAYRGTSGTEVAYVIRTLLDRLGLTPDSKQLRVLATSASLDEGGKHFLEDFFGIPIDRFEIITGEREGQIIYNESNEFKDKKDSFIGFYHEIKNKCIREEEAIKNFCQSLNSIYDPSSPLDSLYYVLEKSGVLNAFIRQCEKPRSLKDLSIELFNESLDMSAIGGLLHGIVTARRKGQVVLPLRAHLFFRNFQGLWACSNPKCSEVKEEYNYEGRRVGKLYHQPQVQCSCGSKILDFYYCQNCGDPFLGGYKIASNHPDEENGGHFI